MSIKLFNLKLSFTILMSFILVVCQELPNARKAYIDASKSQKNAEAFYDLMANYNYQNEVLLAYKGASIALKAKYAKQIKLKKSLFIEGVTIIEKSIKIEPNNIETHLIRLSIQENSPKILNYKSNIDEDKKIILTNFDKQNQSLKIFIKDYIQQSTIFSEKEKKSIIN